MPGWVAERVLANPAQCNYWIKIADAFPGEASEGRSLLIQGDGWQRDGLLARAVRPGEAPQTWRLPVDSLEGLFATLGKHNAVIEQREAVEHANGFRTLKVTPQSLRPFAFEIKVQPRESWTVDDTQWLYSWDGNSNQLGRHRKFIEELGTHFDALYATAPSGDTPATFTDLEDAAHFPRKHSLVLSLHRPVPTWPVKPANAIAGYERLRFSAPRMPNMHGAAGFTLDYWADPNHRYTIEPANRMLLEHIMATLAANTTQLDTAIANGIDGDHDLGPGPGGEGLVLEFEVREAGRSKALQVGQCAVSPATDGKLYAAMDELFDQVSALVAAEAVMLDPGE